MIDWKVLESTKLLESPHFNVWMDKLDTGKGEEYYHYNKSNGSVMIVPVEVTEDGTLSFYLVEQYRYPVNLRQLSFPGGGRDRGEPSKEAALRELKEETGLVPREVKFVYSMFPAAGRTNQQMAVYMAFIDKEPEETELDDSEARSELKTIKVSSDDLHKMISDNEITDACTLAALSCVMLQSKESLRYLQEEPESN